MACAHPGGSSRTPPVNLIVEASDLMDDRPAGARAFDFLLGSWTVRNQVLRGRLQGSDEWEEWDATLDVVPVLGGLGNVDRFRTVRNGRYFEGVSLRVFDPDAEEWRIYWMDTSHPLPVPQVTGTFEDGRGIFYGTEEFDGRTVDLRFTWEREGPDRARWEQAYSDDGGRNWETNWIMTFRRREG